ncbi:MAG: pilus assembly protein PilM [Planctomycetota bacterium]
MGACGVRMLQLSMRGGEVQAKAAAFAPLPNDLRLDTPEYSDALSAAIQSAYHRGGFTGNRVVSSLPVSAMQCKNLRLPMMPADELDSAVQWEAADRFRMGEGQCSVQYMHAGQVNQGDEVRQELILLAAKLGLVESHVAALTGNSLRPVAIDSVPSALARLSVMRHALLSETHDASMVNVTLDVGQSSTKVLIALDAQVRFYKPIEIGGGSFESVLSGAMSISLDESRDLLRALGSPPTHDETQPQEERLGEATRTAVMEALRPTLGELAREIGLCLRYYGVTFRGARPSRAQLVGGAATPWLASALSESTGLTLGLDQPLGGMDLSAVRDTVRPGSEGAWAVAAGLSIREHMKHFATKPQASESDDESVFEQTPRSEGVAA